MLKIRRVLPTGTTRVCFGFVLAFGAATAASAASGTTPHYIESMAAFEVRALDGEFAPADAKISMQDITPAAWLSNDPGVLNLSGVIRAWNGGAKGTGTRIFVHGGGHTDSANNGLYIYDFSGSDRPVGWQTPLVISELSAVVPATMTYLDGKPTTVHTYDGMVYASHNNFIYRFNGAGYNPAGGMSTGVFKFDVANQTWHRLADYPSGTGGATTVYDPVSGKVFVTNSGSLSGHFFRTASDTWSAAKTLSAPTNYDASAAWDPTRNRGVVVGKIRRLINLNFATETVSVSDLVASGATEILDRPGISVVYDAGRDAYWLFGGKTDSPGWNSIYEMNANTFSIVQHALTGDNIVPESNMQGSYGRYVLMADWRALGVVASHDSAPYVIRLPDGQPQDQPLAPTDLSAQ